MQELSFTVLFLNPCLSYTLNLFIIPHNLATLFLYQCVTDKGKFSTNGSPFEILENTSKKQVLVPLVVVRTVMVSDLFHDKPNHRSQMVQEH